MQVSISCQVYHFAVFEVPDADSDMDDNEITDLISDGNFSILRIERPSVKELIKSVTTSVIEWGPSSVWYAPMSDDDKEAIKTGDPKIIDY